MTVDAQNLDPILESWSERFRAAPEARADWQATLRREAMDHFLELGFPTTRLEEWRYTRIAPIAKTAFALANAVPAIEAGAIANLLGELAGERLVFVDGHYAEVLSRRGDGAEVERLESLVGRAASREEGPLAHFARIAPTKDDAFTSLNTALATDGAVVTLPANRRLDAPVHLLFVSSAGTQPRACHPRVLIVAQPGSEGVVVLDHVSLGRGRTFTNSVVEVSLEANASLDLVVVQREGEEALQISRQAVAQARDSRYAQHTFNLGGALVRNDLSIELRDEGAECSLRGLAITDAKQLVDNHTLVDHAMPHTSSGELYKSILAGTSRSVFRGRVVVRPGAQKISAEQQSRNLILERGPEVDTKPQLEIYADDVKCSHGSTIGQLDPEALFFLRSRGLDERAARGMLAEGFAVEIAETLPESLREWLADGIRNRLRALLDGGSNDG